MHDFKIGDIVRHATRPGEHIITQVCLPNCPTMVTIRARSGAHRYESTDSLTLIRRTDFPAPKMPVSPMGGEPEMPVNAVEGAQEALQRAQVAFDEAQEAEARQKAAIAAKEAEEAAMTQRIAVLIEDKQLAVATNALLEAVHMALTNRDYTLPSNVAFRRGLLQPLAKKHGFTIVLFGNGSQAMLKEVA